MTLVLLLPIGVITAVLLAHPDDPKEKDRQPVYDGPGFKRAQARPGEEPRVLATNREELTVGSDRTGIDAERGDARALAGTTFDAVGLRLQSWITIPEFNAAFTSGNDIWGYVSPSGREYAIMGLSGGTGFVEVTDPANATIVDVMPGPNSTWRDMKTYGEFAYTVSEGGGGIQVFDLTDIDNGNITELTAITTPGTLKSHNVALEPESGVLYRVGGREGGIDYGLRAYDLTNPAIPSWIGDWSDRYVHDAQVVTMNSGPWSGKQIGFLCSGFNGGWGDTGLDIVDLTDPASPINLSRINYVGRQYSHQAWLSEDQQFIFLNDELDEDNSLPTIIHVIDVSDLANPVIAGRFASNSTSIGHNVFTEDGRLFAANYRSGLRVFDIGNPIDAPEVAFFDTYPTNDNANYNGLWGTYPYLPSGTIIGSDIEKGLFVWTLEAVVGFPDGRPGFIDPAGDTLRVDFEELNGTIDGATAMLVYDIGAGSQSIPLVPVEGSITAQYEAVLPALPCGTTFSYHVTAQTTDGVLVQSPTTAPSRTYEAIAAYMVPALLFDDAESDLGWSVGDDGATAGTWERGVPVNDENWEYDVESAAGGSGSAWLTANVAANSDVDNGTVYMTSPELDLTYGNVEIAYEYFLRSTMPEGGLDRVFVEITENESGGVWTEIDSTDTDTGYSWVQRRIDQAAIEAAGVTMTSTMKIRFSAVDAGTQSVVEAGIDNILIGQAACCAGDCSGGPVAGDGSVDILDLLSVLSAWGQVGSVCDHAPAFGDGIVGIEDLLNVLSEWGPCD